MIEYVQGSPPDRWHWNKGCTLYPRVIIKRRSRRPSSDLCDECQNIEKRAQYQRDLSRSKVVKDIMSRDVVTITPEASMVEAAKTMGEKHIGSLIVKKYEAPVGIVTDRDLISKVWGLGKDPKVEKVEAVMSYPLNKICPTVKIKQAAQMMIRKKGRLAVFDCGELVGIVTTTNFIRSLPEVLETDVKVDDFMTKKIETVDDKTSVDSIVKMMAEKGVGSIIVTSKGDPFGIFTERDLITNFLVMGRSLIGEVGKGTSSPLITTTVGTSIHQAAVTMAMKHIRRLPITRKGKIVGIITTRDLVQAYAK